MTDQNKTQPTNTPVADFIAALNNEQAQNDAAVLCEMMHAITNQPATMWGPSIIGFGTYHYKYASGREGDTCVVGFSPRKGKLVLYLGDTIHQESSLMQKLGPHSTSKACLYIKKLQDVDLITLRQLVAISYKTYAQ